MRGKTACRVLFVEDEAMVSMLIEDMLLDLGVEVVGPAAKLEEALHLARSADIEAALLDINIGGQFTYPVADILAERGIPVIFATGYGSSALPDRFRGTPTLHKPFDLRGFAAVVEAALAGSPCEINAADAL
ncbi:MAG TPA: response regulator [Microvirga sp.]|jgi:DNA-binding response OmpR family regulator|nr:response regulator [Microvirga sp.]